MLEVNFTGIQLKIKGQEIELTPGEATDLHKKLGDLLAVCPAWPPEFPELRSDPPEFPKVRSGRLPS